MQTVLVSALCSGAFALPAWLLLALGGLFTGVFLFLPWSASPAHIAFIVVSVLIGFAFAVLHWRLSPRRVTPSVHDRDVMDPGLDSSVAHLPQHLPLTRDPDDSCFPVSPWTKRCRNVLPVLELLILGILVLVSPHVMSGDTTGGVITVAVRADSVSSELVYPVEIAWKVCFLHLWFLLTFSVSFAADLVTGLLHFAVLMAHYQNLGGVTMMVSAMWLALPVLCIACVAAQHQRRLQCQRHRDADMWQVGGDAPIRCNGYRNAANMLDDIECLSPPGDIALQQRTTTLLDRHTMKSPSSLEGHNYFATVPTSVIARRWRKQFAGKDTQRTEPLVSDVLQNKRTISPFSDDLRAPYLLINSGSNIIVSASVSFAARVRIAVENLVGRPLTAILKELEVENVSGLMEVIRSVVHPAGNDGLGGTERGPRGRREARRSASPELSLDAGAILEGDGGDYSTVQGRASLSRMGDDNVSRVVLRGRCPRDAQDLQPVGDALPAARGCRSGSRNSSPAPELDATRSALFSITLDVWMEWRRGSTDSFIVLRQPRLHCALDWTPLSCFLAQPMTGQVLYWNPAAEQQTGLLAYDMIGWPVHASPLPGTSEAQSDYDHNIHCDGTRDAEWLEQRRGRWSRLESPLRALVHIPSSVAAPLVVTLQPLTGEFMDDEGAALDGDVAGLMWPPRHYTKAEVLVSEGRRAASYPPEAREYRLGGNVTPIKMHCVLGDSPPTHSSDVNGIRSVTAWNFGSLVANRSDAGAWPIAGVPLLFVIQDEMHSSPSSTSNHHVAQLQNSMHAISEFLQKYRDTLGDDFFVGAKPDSSSTKLNGEVTSSNTAGQLQKLKEAMNQVAQAIDVIQEAQGTSAPSRKSNEAKTNDDIDGNTNNNNAAAAADDDDDNAGDDEVFRAAVDGRSKVPPTSGVPALGLTPTPQSAQTSHLTSKRPSPLLVDNPGVASREEEVKEHALINDGGVGGVNDEDRERGSKARGPSGSGGGGLAGSSNTSHLRKTGTPSGGRSRSMTKNTSAPRLISPLPMEHSNMKTNDEVNVIDETVMQEENASGDPACSAHHHTHNSPRLQQPAASIIATLSAANSAAPSDFVASPTVNNSLNNEEPPIWAMLRSSDEATIPSCFIRVASGEAFRFGRSSKCHATTSDTFVSSIQFTIVRQPGPQPQFVQPSIRQYRSNGSPSSGHRQTSSLSSPCHPPIASGNWIVLLHDNSANGTYVNVKKVNKGKSCALRDHDLITFRLSSSRFFLGFQFLLTDERGVPLREAESAVTPTLSRMDSTGMSRRGTPYLHQRNSSDNGSIAAASGSQVSGAAHNTNNNTSVGSSRRVGTNMRSRSGRPGGGTHHRETIEWKIGEEMLGKGGNAEVYLGINLTNGKLIAVKRVLLPTGATGDPASKDVLQQYRSLQEEINVLSKAVHPNIVQYFGSSQNQKYFNILLEFVPGGSLRHLLDNFGALGPGVICSYLRQTLEGLRYLHQHNIVHSDVKAANILITDKGRVKLSDFGTAKLLNRGHSQSVDRAGKAEAPSNCDAATYRLAGTLRWMAPELFRGDGNVGPTKASDMWSVGCAVIEMLSSEGPWYEYEFESEEQIINLLKYATEPPEVPECPELPELTAIAKRCLTLMPEARPTCEELLQMVAEAAERFHQQQEIKSPLQRGASLSPQPTAPQPSVTAMSGEASDSIKKEA
ncbi:putative protein kinase [Trypanosoma grayi]|uniref:putative protein kinase n=1 Tax=Trypanosoma grayi TaxID=71804 RepID=UPI0004F49B11|nr:putative protein kinase [Trypanosoma grayi]KEG11733.1 putative protein kinase [Trypanosoma grayi]